MHNKHVFDCVLTGTLFTEWRGDCSILGRPAGRTYTIMSKF